MMLLILDIDKPTAKDDRQQLVNSNTVQDGRLRPFVHRLASLDQQMRTVEAKFYLCNDDIRQLTQQGKIPYIFFLLNTNESIGDSTSLEELRERLKREYLSIEQDFNQMVVEWEAGRDALVNFLDPPDLDPSPSSSISSPTASQKEDDSSPVTSPSTNPQKVVDSEDNGLLELPLPARASVFEAVAETIERNTIERPKKSRAQRIAEMKAKREQEVRGLIVPNGREGTISLTWSYVGTWQSFQDGPKDNGAWTQGRAWQKSQWVWTGTRNQAWTSCRHVEDISNNTLYPSPFLLFVFIDGLIVIDVIWSLTSGWCGDDFLMGRLMGCRGVKKGRSSFTHHGNQCVVLVLKAHRQQTSGNYLTFTSDGIHSTVVMQKDEWYQQSPRFPRRVMDKGRVTMATITFFQLGVSMFPRSCSFFLPLYLDIQNGHL